MSAEILPLSPHSRVPIRNCECTANCMLRFTPGFIRWTCLARGTDEMTNAQCICDTMFGVSSNCRSRMLYMLYSSAHHVLKSRDGGPMRVVSQTPRACSQNIENLRHALTRNRRRLRRITAAPCPFGDARGAQDSMAAAMERHASGTKARRNDHNS